ncbi:hypothetical protein A0U87_11805 [Sphingobium sp. MP9-4]|nr:hypothetical protein A0U87_11805 [Sphingobium sp. MP9-4]
MSAASGAAARHDRRRPNNHFRSDFYIAAIAAPSAVFTISASQARLARQFLDEVSWHVWNTLVARRVDDRAVLEGEGAADHDEILARSPDILRNRDLVSHD